MGPLGLRIPGSGMAIVILEVEIDKQKVVSVSGGGHWGGGMVISSRDLARFGLLFLRKGNWNGNS